MAISTEYRMHFESEGESQFPTSLEISGGGEADDASVWLSTPHDGHGEHALFLQLSRKEALELKAILGVLTGTANQEEEAVAGAAS